MIPTNIICHLKIILRIQNTSSIWCEDPCKCIHSIKRRDKYWFEKTSRKYNDEEVVKFLVSNFAYADNPQNLWIGEIISSGERTYQDWTKRTEFDLLVQRTKQRITLEQRIRESIQLLERSSNNLKRFLGGDISLETFVIYDRIFSFRKKFDKKLKDPVWETVSLKLQKIFSLSKY